MPNILTPNLVTTQKQLTAHFIKQMEIANLTTMTNGKAIGYVNYNSCKLGLIKFQEDYFKLDLQLPKSDHINRSWWSAYQIIKLELLKRHLYYVE